MKQLKRKAEAGPWGLGPCVDVRVAVQATLAWEKKGLFFGGGPNLKRRVLTREKALRREKKEGRRGKEGGFSRLWLCFAGGDGNATPPTTPDRHVPTGSVPRGRSRAHLLFEESSVLFRKLLNSILNAIKM